MSGSTSLLKLIKPTVSGDADVWGGYLNTNFDSIDKLIDVITTGGSANAYTLTSGQTLTAYATGQRFRCKLNFTCTGSSTLNVDSLGAKTIKKRDAATNVSSGDLVSGQVYTFTYDSTNFVLETYVPSDVQPLDATLTALAALSWSSGNALVQFTAADTVSLTLTPSVSSITASQGAAATTPTGKFTNTTDAASVQAQRLDGDRATPAANDELYVSYYLSNSAGTQTEFGRLTISGSAVTAASEVAVMAFSVIVSGTLTSKMQLSGGTSSLRPTTNDGLALGTTAQMWSDLFLASGGVINWNNGDVLLTHSSGLLSLTGALQARVALSSETSGTLTAASANKKVLASGGITMPASVFTAHDAVKVDANGTARTITRGAGLAMYVNGADVATATLAPQGVMVADYRTAGVVILSGAVS